MADSTLHLILLTLDGIQNLCNEIGFLNFHTPKLTDYESQH